MATRSQWRRRRALVYGAGVLVFFVGLVVLALVSQHGLPFAPRTTVKAAFDDVGSLRTGDDVRIANVRVGYISAIDLANSTDEGASGEAKQAVATLKLDDQRPVYNNAQAITVSVGARSALGEKFVDLNPGNPAAGRLSPDHVIAAQHTVGAQELSDVLAVLDLPTRQAIGSLVRNVGGGLAGHGTDLHAAFTALPDVLPDLGNVSQALANNNGKDFAALLTSTNELSNAFQGRQQQIGQLLGKLDNTFAGLNADNGKALADTLQTAPRALRQTKAALDSLNTPLRDTTTAARGLRPGGEALGQATPDVRGFLTESRSPLDKVPGVSDDAQPALDELSDTFNKAQPFTPMLDRTLGRGAPLAQVISAYSPQASLFFTNVVKALGQGNDNFHWLNFSLNQDASPLVSDALNAPVKDPLMSRDGNPAPGESPMQRQSLPGLLNGLGGK